MTDGDSLRADAPSRSTDMAARGAATWRAAGPGRGIALAAIGAPSVLLLGAFLFGAWHVLFGGLVRGNARAGAFGVGLCAAAEPALAIVSRMGRRTARA